MTPRRCRFSPARCEVSFHAASDALRSLIARPARAAGDVARRRAVTVAGVLVLAWLFALTAGADSARAGTVPAGFTDSVAISGLTEPTAVRFAPDGRVFVAEKSGLIKVFDSLSDPTPTVFADLRTKVHNFWDRGLLGLALDPAFPAKPYVYVLYTYDQSRLGGSGAALGHAGASSDPCPTPPGPTADGCVVSGRLSRLQRERAT